MRCCPTCRAGFADRLSTAGDTRTHTLTFRCGAVHRLKTNPTIGGYRIEPAVWMEVTPCPNSQRDPLPAGTRLDPGRLPCMVDIRGMVSPQLREAARAEARRKGTCISAVVREALEQHLRREG